MFAASLDDPKTNKAFAQSMGVEYPILSDPDKKAAADFGVLHPSGQFAQRWTFFIVDGIVKAILKDVDVYNHGKQVLEQLNALGIPKKANGNE